MISLIKNIICLGGPIYFLNDFKNHSSDDTWLQKKYYNASQLIYR